MFLKNRKAFTMLELTFVIVIIGILSAIAVPKFVTTRDDAVITKARATVAAVRNSIATERQKRILKGDFVNAINALSMNAVNIFDRFNPDRDDIAAGRTFGNSVTEYPVSSCATLGKITGCWMLNAGNYRYLKPDGTPIDFNLNNNRFTCVLQDANCRLLTQ